MVKIRFFLIAVLLPTLLLGESGPIRLQYAVNQPVFQTSSVEIEVSRGQAEETPSTARQEIKARLAIIEKKDRGTFVKPSMNLQLTLESLQVGMEAEGHSLKFDSEHPNGSPLMTEIAKIIDRPLTVVVGEDLKIETDSKDFLKLSQSLEQIGGFRTTNLFSEMLQNLFALAGRDLEVGDEYTLKLALGADERVPLAITYKIVAITGSEVRAVVTGGFDLVEITQPVSSQDRLFLAGKIDGKAVWNRRNALIYKTRIHYSYDGVLEEDGQETPIYLHLRHEDTSRAL